MVQALVDLAQGLWFSFRDAIPSIVGAVLLLAVGYIVGRVLGRVSNEVVKRLKLDTRVSQSAHLRLRLSHLSDVVVRWVIYLVFIQQAADVLGSGAVSAFVGSIVNFLPEVIGAGAIVLAAYAIGIYFKEHIVSAHTIYSDLTGKVIFFLVLYLGLSVALRVVNIPLLIVDQILLVIIASLGLGIAIAIGLGLKDTIRDVSKSYAARHSRRK